MFRFLIAAVLLTLAGCGPLTPDQMAALRAIADAAPAAAPAAFPDYAGDFSPPPNLWAPPPSGPGPVMGCDHCGPYSPQVQQLFDMAAGRP